MPSLYRTILKPIFDFLVALILLSILFVPAFYFTIRIFLQDFSNPFYIPKRVGKNKKNYNMIKFRSMIVNADSSKVDSTSSSDSRITNLGNFIRRYKIDEIPNLINILTFKMSFVGPRPNVDREVNLYTDEEIKILRVRPGITDISSIVFADEGDILEYSIDPDLDYNQLIRPWKSRLAILYTEKASLFLDLKLMILTLYNFIDRKKTLQIISNILKNLDAPENLINVVLRENKLVPTPPPGREEIVTTRSN
jgi:lipopolysaccharide/colanic/teichoic acid biosynthesis glycosyltransferase